MSESLATESIGGRIEIIGHAIATLTEAMKAIDKALGSNLSMTGKEQHVKAVNRIADQINSLAAMQIQLATKFEATA